MHSPEPENEECRPDCFTYDDHDAFEKENIQLRIEGDENCEGDEPGEEWVESKEYSIKCYNPATGVWEDLQTTVSAGTPHTVSAKVTISAVLPSSPSLQLWSHQQRHLPL